MNKKYDIDMYIEEIVSNSFIKSIYPINIVKNFNVSLEDAVERLNYLVAGGKLKLKYEIRCNDDLNIMKIVEDYSEVINKILYCEHCGKEIEVGLENIYLIYYICEEYREFKKKDLSTRKGLSFNSSNEGLSETNLKKILEQSACAGLDFSNVELVSPELNQLAKLICKVTEQKEIEELTGLDKAIGDDLKKSKEKSKKISLENISNKADCINKLHTFYGIVTGAVPLIHSSMEHIKPLLKTIKSYLFG